MKFWIRHEKRYGLPRVANSIASSKEEALNLSIAHNKYYSYMDGAGEFLALDIQEIEVNSDFLLCHLLSSFDIFDCRCRLLSMIEKQDPMIKFGEIVEVPPVEHVVLD